MKTGRNEPCPCGSGKKHKHCCLSQSSSHIEELEELLSNQDINLMEDLQAALNTITAKQNHTQHDDFLGLSSEQVHRMLYFPYDTPELFQFSTQLNIEAEAPILMLIECIASAIDEKGLLATKAKGNLPQKLCKTAWDDYKQHYATKSIHAAMTVNKEDDFLELQVVRITLELAGLLRKTRGRFYLTKKYQKIIKESGLKGLYPIIFKAFCLQFNWAYSDGFDDVPFIQQSFLFSLYLLKQHGKNMTALSVYEDDFLKAFPMVIGDMEKTSYSTPEESARRCYNIRACERFLVFLGLATLEKIPSDNIFEHKNKIQKTALFDAMLHFNIVDPKIYQLMHSDDISEQLH